MQKVIIGFGEILWDLLPGGKALGGAPANFAYHAARLGHQAWAISAIAKDALGDEILESLKDKPLKTILATVPQQTGIVNVSLDEKGIPSYDIVQNVAWDNIPFTEEMKELSQKADAICFGSLVQRMPISRATLNSVLENTPKDCLKVFDINIRQHYYSAELIDENLKHSDVLKINDEEIDIVSKLLNLAGSQEDACKELLEKYPLKFIILTKGEKGSSVVTHSEIIPQIAVKVENIVDTVGAGDAFTSAFVVSYLEGKSLKECQAIATQTAAYVCRHKGAMPL